MTRRSIFLPVFLCLACGPSLEDHIENLSGSPEDQLNAQHELLLAKEQAVEPLLKALKDPRYTTGRVKLADVLVSLMLRVEDPRLAAALQRHLLEDPDAQVRARIAYNLGIHKNVEFAEIFFQALQDTAGQVRYRAMKALGLLESKFDEAQKDRLRQAARNLLEDENKDARIEAMFVVEDHVAQWVKKGQEQALKADLEGAEALFVQALAFSPQSLRANYYLGRFYMDNDQEARGMQVLREIGLLLDVPFLKEAPQIDGRLDEEAWEQAVSFDTFYQSVRNRSAAYLSEVRTRGYVGYTRDALYLATYCYDARPESLVVETHDHDSNISYQDLVQLYLHVDFEPNSFVYISINSVGALTDAWNKSRRDRDVGWETEIEGAIFVGEDFWSVEFRLGLGTEEFPRLRPGDMWRLNMQRNFRGGQFSKWARTYEDRPYPDCFGFLVFE